MMSREFTFKERLLLIAALALAMGIFYYQFAVKWANSQLRSYSTENVEEEIETEYTLQAKIASMQAIIEENKGKNFGTVAVYNNLAAEISYVGSIMEQKAENVSLSWGNPVLTGTTVRRDVRVSFTTNSYENLKELLKAFYECPYRCIVHDLALSDSTPATRNVVTTNPDGTTTTTAVPQKTGIFDSQQMSVSFSATFFETTEGATTTDGLIVVSAGTEEES